MENKEYEKAKKVVFDDFLGGVYVLGELLAEREKLALKRGEDIGVEKGRGEVVEIFKQCEKSIKSIDGHNYLDAKLDVFMQVY